MYDLVTALGWIGAVTCVGAYALVSRGTWAVSSRRFQVANVAAALMMCLVAARGHVWASVAANIVWALIGARTVTTLMRARREQADTMPDRALDDALDDAALVPLRSTVTELEMTGMRSSSVGLVA
ncbi:MAG: CBU_0592 family membrane protein [Cellulomonas sp.]